MAEQKIKPPPFVAPATSLSASALNALREAIPRLITGGDGIIVERFGDRFIVRQAGAQSGKAGSMGLATITAIFDTYLVCTKDGASIKVAKPWGLRRGVDWPAAATYTYSAPGTRSAVQSGYTTETQKITPDYEVGEELLVARLPSARIDDDDGNLIVWYDMNAAGRCWATV